MSVAGNADLKQACDAAGKTRGHQLLESLFDKGTFHEIGRFSKSGETYTEACAGFGMVEGCPLYAFAQDSDVNGGAMSKAQAEKVRKIYALAVKTGAPIVGVFDSIGGKLVEKGDLLSAYGEILRDANNLSGVVPQISLILGPCIGTSAMIAAGADFIVMSKKGQLTIAPNGEGGFAQEAAENGTAALIKDSEEEAIKAVRQLIVKLPSNNLEPAAFMEESEAASVPAAGNTAKEAAKATASKDSIIELSPDFGKDVFSAFSGVGIGTTVGLVSYDGELSEDDCVKAARFIRFCDAFSVPVVSFVNAKGFLSLRAASMLSSAYAEATAAKVTIAVGDAYGPVYIAVAGKGANADSVVAWPQAVISALAPETAAVFLWNDKLKDSKDSISDRKKMIEEYRTTEASPLQAAAQGLIENVIEPEETRSQIQKDLTMLSGKRVHTFPKKHNNIQL
ncbi:carboxyl transferase domain-containing protein [Caproicibacterium sp. NSD3]